jgi:hypothetical protein
MENENVHIMMEQLMNENGKTEEENDIEYTHINREKLMNENGIIISFKNENE